MRTTLISLSVLVALAGCAEPAPLTPAESVRGQGVMDKLAPCENDLRDCLGWILEMENGQLVELSGVYDSGGNVDHGWLRWHLVNERQASKIRTVYTPADPDFHDAVYRKACRQNPACAAHPKA